MATKSPDLALTNFLQIKRRFGGQRRQITVYNFWCIEGAREHVLLSIRWVTALNHWWEYVNSSFLTRTRGIWPSYMAGLPYQQRLAEVIGRPPTSQHKKSNIIWGGLFHRHESLFNNLGAFICGLHINFIFVYDLNFLNGVFDCRQSERRCYETTLKRLILPSYCTNRICILLPVTTKQRSDSWFYVFFSEWVTFCHSEANKFISQDCVSFKNHQGAEKANKDVWN